MKLFSMARLASIATALILLQTSVSSAERYLLTMKSHSLFANAGRLEGRKLNQLQWKQASKTVTPFQNSKVQVEQSLDRLDTLVVQAETEAEVQELLKTGLVAGVEKEFFYPAPKPVQGFRLTQSWSFHLESAVVDLSPVATSSQPWGIAAIHAPEAWEISHQGAGARVMVLDTGIDREHPALKDNFEQGRDFTGERKGPYEYADLEGHGTHVAATIAARQAADGFVGVAPKAKILMGKVCSVQGCSNINVAAGMNWAIQENVDVVNMSLGGMFGSGSQKRAAEAMEKAGIVVVCASGNDGKPTVSFPGAYPTVIAVGAVDSKIEKGKFSNWGPELDVMAPGVDVISAVPLGSGREALVQINGLVVSATSFVGSPEISQGMTNELVSSGLGKPEDFTEAVKAKYALIQRGQITFADKVKNAIAAGAAGAVIYNTEAGLLNGSLTNDGSTVAIPVVMIEKGIGEQIQILISQGKTVRALMQTLATDYASFQGTSMASPHVAGVVALMKATDKSINLEKTLSILKSTATAISPNSENEVGSGMVNAEAAVKAVLAVKAF